MLSQISLSLACSSPAKSDSTKMLSAPSSFFKRAPNGVEVDRLDDVQLDDLVGQKPDRPTCMTFRRLRTSSPISRHCEERASATRQSTFGPT